MRLWGLPRDYILGFLFQPGRVLSPACVGEIANGTIGADVEPASEDAVRLFVSERVNAFRIPLDDKFDGPVSPWRVQQALLWSRRRQQELFHREGYEIEFKIIFQDSAVQLAKYMKTMSAIANSNGGYIFFGVNDSGMPVRFDPDGFLQHDWDSFDQLVQDRFDPYIRWERSVVDVPTRPEIQFDSRLIRRLAEQRGIEPERYAWITSDEFLAPETPVGVIYVYKSGIRIRCRRTVKNTLSAGKTYVRLHARNHALEDHQKLPDVPAQQSSVTPEDEKIARLKAFEDMTEKPADSDGLSEPLLF
jgi:hypothetical protein